ncbi:MAG: cyclohydrolase [Bacteroidota bacterium]|jgi:GTP cyclohydrolase II
MDKITLQGEAEIPTQHGRFIMRAYSCKEDDYIPTIVLYNPNTKIGGPVNVRIHSECITGDLFGSRKCECGEQLDKSMEIVGLEGGIIIYLRQEGRGIGIINKLHAYKEQEKGLDTIEANKVLGFEIDARRYDIAINILKELKITKVKLLTNNPEKVLSLKEAGFESVERISLEIKPSNENMDYLRTKKDDMGHKLKLI